MPWCALKHDALTWLWYNNIIFVNSNYMNITCILVTHHRCRCLCCWSNLEDSQLLSWNTAYVPTSPMDTTLAFLFFVVTVECSELDALSYIGPNWISVHSYLCVHLQVEHSHESIYGDKFCNHYNNCVAKIKCNYFWVINFCGWSYPWNLNLMPKHHFNRSFGIFGLEPCTFVLFAKDQHSD